MTICCTTLHYVTIWGFDPGIIRLKYLLSNFSNPVNSPTLSYMDSTSQRLKELLKTSPQEAIDYARSSGLIRTLAKLDPVWHVRDMGFVPDPWQAKLLRSQHKNIAVICSRQAGKTTTCAMKVHHSLTYKPNAFALIVSASLNQATELFDKIGAANEKASTPLKTTTANTRQVRYTNGARLVVVPSVADIIRGFSGVTDLFEDEAAVVGDDVYAAVAPMVAASQGTHVMLSSPGGQLGHYYTACTSGNWEVHKVTARDIPRIPKAWLDQQKKEMPAWQFAREFMCEFTATDDAVFDPDLIRAAVRSDVRVLDIL